MPASKKCAEEQEWQKIGRLFMLNRSKIILLFWFLSGVLTTLQALEIRTSVDKTSLALNQQIALTIELSGDGANKVSQPTPPDMSDFLSFLGSGGSSQNIQLINGRMSVTRSNTYYYMATKEGVFQIPAVSVNYKGKQAKSEPISITITKSVAQTNPLPRTRSDVQSGRNNGSNLYVRAVVSKRRVYQNEPVIVTFRIYTRINVSSYGISKLPETAGFWSEEFDLSKKPTTREEIINGKKYVVADIKKAALFPTSPGKKTIGPLSLDCEVRVQSQRRSRDNVFDSFFNDPFFSRTTRKTIASPPVTIDVLPLPAANRPADFSGAVGKFNLTASIDKNSVKTNEAITLKVRISGTGNIRTLSKPVVQVPHDFEKYEPKVTENIVRQNNTISGSKNFEYVLIPRFPGAQKIKPIYFSYFNPKLRKYQELTTPELLINVEKSADEYVSLGSGINKEEVKLIGQDIRFIKTVAPDFKRIGYQPYKSFAYLSLVILPMLLLAAAYGYSKHQEKLSGNVAYARNRRANRMAMKRLSKAHSLLDEKAQKEFYAEASRALLGFAADKLNLAEAGIISSELKELFAGRNLDADLIDAYIKLIQECDYQRFAPANVSKEQMTDFYKQAKEAIINLEKAL